MRIVNCDSVIAAPTKGSAKLVPYIAFNALL